MYTSSFSGFSGHFRTKPTVALGGASRKEPRDELLKRAQEEREKREEQRRRQNASITIQSYTRGMWVRNEQKDHQRMLYDACLMDMERGQVTPDPSNLSWLARRLLFFYTQQQDTDRLVKLCQLLLKKKNVGSLVCTIGKETWTHQIKRVLLLCSRYLEMIAQSHSPIAVPLRTLETFTDAAVYQESSLLTQQQSEMVVSETMQYLCSHGYFRHMGSLVNNRIPDSIEHSTSPPTPLAATLLEFIVKPLTLISSQQAKDTYRNTVLWALCKDLLTQPITEQVRNFVLPAMAGGKRGFPFEDLLQALAPVSHDDPANEGESSPVSHSRVEPSPWLLYSLLELGDCQVEKLSQSSLTSYLHVLETLLPTLPSVGRAASHQAADSDSEDEDMETLDPMFLKSGSLNSPQALREQCIAMLGSWNHINCFLRCIFNGLSQATLLALCSILHTLMARHNLQVHKFRLLYTLAFNGAFLRQLYAAVLGATKTTATGSKVQLLQLLAGGIPMAPEDAQRVVPPLSLFCSLFSHSLMSLHDIDFYAETPDRSHAMPFRLSDLVSMSAVLRDVCVGIIELAIPDTKPTVGEDYRKAMNSVGARVSDGADLDFQRQTEDWAHLFKVITHVVAQLKARDTRQRFCPYGHWLSTRVNIQATRPSAMQRGQTMSLFGRRRPFPGLVQLGRSDMDANDEDAPLLSVTETRQLTILKELPFVVPFEERVKLFQQLILKDKDEHQADSMFFLERGNSRLIDVMIRRNYIYEDAYDKLSPENEPNLKKRMRVNLVNFQGLEEAGIDGGGIFREFLHELLKAGFDPNRGFFQTTNDGQVYPNPASELLVEHYARHYYFLGRMLGKALYENMLVEIPFASFFLSKILSKHNHVDIDQLQSLDPEVYRNLLFLKNYDGDVSDLALNFTIVNNDLGEAQVVELKPGGQNIPVTSENRIQYIHLVADYRLNKQIRAHCMSFRQGLADVVNLEWLRMFDDQELQVVISGSQQPVDVTDLRKHTNYSGGYTDEHPVIENFWKVVREFTNGQRRHLLKFVTSCSRPPLLGFKELYPAFCIHHGGPEEDRLPSASTCMNLLKLPEFQDEETMRSKLLYAVESNAGFELS
ncbi:UBE3C [Branchiostoma lanceolatum]|uniref:Ubiquitin-protein ligase E3C n=1 Tax=Branchiostoma lanceolatum TaxID=7740 RepID=A0A8K0E722_BRALA|nr:UBE3C [Branchiostoma lanceolatum]